MILIGLRIEVNLVLGTILLYDINGRPVKKLVQATQAAGRHTLVIPTSDLPAGQYIISLTAKNGVLSRKLLVQH